MIEHNKLYECSSKFFELNIFLTSYRIWDVNTSLRYKFYKCDIFIPYISYNIAKAKIMNASIKYINKRTL